MKVSVILPTYHREWELKRALQSLSGQDFSGFEAIVVDDNNDVDWTHKVKKIVSDVQQENPAFSVRCIHNRSRCGSAESRNVGVQEAKGEYITFLDDDDEYLLGKIKRQYTFMVDNNLDYSITDLDLYLENGRLLECRRRSYIEKTDRISLQAYHFMYHLTGTDTIMMKKAYFEKIGGFPLIDLGDEFYLMHRAIENDGAFGYLEGCDVRAYVHTGAGGLSSGEGKIAGENQLYEYKKKYLHLLSAKNVRYVKMRHYAVLCFAGLRMRNMGYFLKYGFLGFVSAPVQCINMLLNQRKGLQKGNEAEKASV